jgi:dephospho-CoA kinase
MSKRSPPWVGLTGGIASGKSTVATLLRKRGYAVVDADEIARALRAPGGAAGPEIQKRFGTLDPQELREKVFQDPNARAVLEAILHPLIRTESLRELERLAAHTSRPVFYEAALILESGRCGDFDALWVVTSPEESRLTRLLARSGMTDTLARRILNSQLTDVERRASATHWIDNSGTLEDLERAIDSALTSLHRAP